MVTPAKIVTSNLPTVALVGRVNVGKSTLFNKLTESSQALVSAVAGTTRTRNIANVVWRSKNFRLVDTGGLTFSEDVPLEKEIIKQTELALKEADLIIFMVDAKTGPLPQERQLAKKLMKQKQKVLLVVNKVDGPRQQAAAAEHNWQQLGLGQAFDISAASGYNVGDLLDIVYKKLNKLPKRPKKSKEVHPIKVTLIGKPNVGKSTLFNSLIGKEEVIVSDLAHTTREPHDTLTKFDQRLIQFIDTAGIRRKTKVKGELETAGIQKSIKAIKKSDIVLLLIDASESISSQDKQLGGLLRENTRSVIIIINKWDLADENTDLFKKEVRARIYNSFPHLKFAPIVFTSAKSQYKVHKIFPLIVEAWQGRNIEIDPVDLDKFFRAVTKKHLPTRGKGTRHPKLLSLKQVRANPPMFELGIKVKTSVHSSYVNYLENQLREKFGFYAAPIVIRLTKRKK